MHRGDDVAQLTADVDAVGGSPRRPLRQHLDLEQADRRFLQLDRRGGDVGPPGLAVAAELAGVALVGEDLELGDRRARHQARTANDEKRQHLTTRSPGRARGHHHVEPRAGGEQRGAGQGCASDRGRRRAAARPGLLGKSAQRVTVGLTQT